MELTPQEKTNRMKPERREREEDFRALCEDRRSNLRILRGIRDNENAADADRIAAIALIRDITSNPI